jgi:hypothetical protein
MSGWEVMNFQDERSRDYWYTWWKASDMGELNGDDEQGRI